MIDYSKHSNAVTELEKSQTAERDRRQKIREVEHFVNDPDGQWEQFIIDKFVGRPRYTFDMCNPVIGNIWGEMAQNDFDIKIRPSGGDATKEIAKTYDGIIRDIETRSDASNVYSLCGKKMITTGMAAWRVTTEWADADAFHQDFFIRPIHNAVDRLWWAAGTEDQNREDAPHCIILDALTPERYEALWPDGSKSSLSTSVDDQKYYFKPELIVVGEIIYKKPIKKTLYLMTDGSIYEEKEVKPVLDELKKQGIKVERKRDRESFKIMSRFFDGLNWLDTEKELPFDHIPVATPLANYSIVEDKQVYWGAIEHLIDAQRVYNYSESRKVEEVALAPRKKLMVTRKQVGPDKSKYENMNNSADPALLWTPDAEAPPPFETGGPQINPGLSEVSSSMTANIERSSGVFGVNPQNNTGLQSNVALERLENRGQIGTYEYFKALEIAICYTGKVLVNAIPKVKDIELSQRVINEDGSFEMVKLNETVIDEQTGQPVVLNDLSQGIYDVTCDIGPAFKNKQQETVTAFTDLAAIDPSILQRGADIMLNNIQAPGMDLMAERARVSMFQQGIIPESQMTDEEKEKVAIAQQQAAQQGQQLDPIQQAVIEQTQAQTADVMSKAQERTDKTQIEIAKLELKSQELEAKEVQGVIDAQQNQEKIDNQQEKDMMSLMLQVQQQQAAQQAQMAQSIKTLADGFKSIREGTGAEMLMAPDMAEAAAQQSEMLTEAQEQVLGGEAVDTNVAAGFQIG